MNRLLLQISISALIVGIVFAEDTKITQDEVYRIIDSETLLYYHPDDAESSIKFLRSKGASDFMIAEALAKVLQRDYNCAPSEEGGVKSHTAINWLGEVANSSQLTNLVFVALNSTNSCASLAVQIYYRRCKNKADFISAAPLILERRKMDDLRSTVWECLKLEAKGAESNKVAAIARKYMYEYEDGLSLFHADRILCITQPDYASGKTRISILQNAVKDTELRKTYPVVHDILSKTLDKERKNER